MRRDLTVPEEKKKEKFYTTLAEANLITFYGHHEILSPKLGPLIDLHAIILFLLTSMYVPITKNSRI